MSQITAIQFDELIIVIILFYFIIIDVISHPIWQTCGNSKTASNKSPKHNKYSC
jgi:hypothetical protein